MLYEGLAEEFTSEESNGQAAAGTSPEQVVFNGRPGELGALGYTERWLN